MDKFVIVNGGTIVRAVSEDIAWGFVPSILKDSSLLILK